MRRGNWAPNGGSRSSYPRRSPCATSIFEHRWWLAYDEVVRGHARSELRDARPEQSPSVQELKDIAQPKLWTLRAPMSLWESETKEIPPAEAGLTASTQAGRRTRTDSRRSARLIAWPPARSLCRPRGLPSMMALPGGLFRRSAQPSLRTRVRADRKNISTPTALIQILGFRRPTTTSGRCQYIERQPRTTLCRVLAERGVRAGTSELANLPPAEGVSRRDTHVLRLRVEPL